MKNKKETVKVNSKYPRWIPEKIVCDWCEREMLIAEAKVLSEEECVEATYFCNNIKCSCNKVLQKRAEFILRFSGKRSVDLFNKYMAENNKSLFEENFTSWNFNKENK